MCEKQGRRWQRREVNRGDHVDTAGGVRKIMTLALTPQPSTFYLSGLHLMLIYISHTY